MLAPALIALFAAHGLIPTASAGLLINEVLYDASGSTDDGFEWVEICNSGSTTIDLARYQLESAGSSWSESYTFGSGTLAPGAYAIVGYGGTTWSGSFSPNLQNGGSSADGVRLKDASGNVLDTVLYDAPNSSGLFDDSSTTVAAADAAIAPAASSGKSIGRFPDCTDTNDSGADFVLYDTPNPGVANVDTSGGGTDSGGTDTGTASGADCSVTAGVTINEFTPATGVEWVELYNDNSAAIDLGGWELAYGTSTFSKTVAVPDGTVLPAYGWIVLGSAGAAVKDVSISFDPGNATSSADAMRLQCNGSAVDTVIYGSASTNADGWADDDGNTTTTSFAPVPGSGESAARLSDGLDTNQSGADFAVTSTPSPDASNPVVVGPDCTGSDGVTINEFTPATGAEWVEFYNSGSEAVSLGGWNLAFGSSSFSDGVTVPDGTILPAGGWLVIGSSGAAVKDIAIDFNPGNATSSADAFQLQCNGAAVDTVIYGDADTNADGWMDDDGNVTTSFAPVPGSGESSARVADGQDTNQSGADFAVSSAPSPGASNPVIVCDTAGGAVVRLNEFLYDPGSTDGGKEWVELYNNGTTAVRLDGYQIETATSSWGVDFVFPPSTEIAPGGFLLIGGDGVADIDYQADSFSLGNGGDGDGLRLVDCAGTVVDTVLYGDTMADGLTGDDGSDDVVASVDSDVSIGRTTDGVDTNAVSDWMAFSTVTPGAPNGSDPSAGDSDTDTDTGGGGCGGNRPTTTRPGASCAVSTPLGGGEVFLAALVLLRRKRRTA